MWCHKSKAFTGDLGQNRCNGNPKHRSTGGAPISEFYVDNG
jgi:hypothetical protein